MPVFKDLLTEALWTVVSAVLPAIPGLVACFLVAQVWWLVKR